MTSAQTYWSYMAHIALKSPHACVDSVNNAFPDELRTFWLTMCDFKEEDTQNDSVHSFGILKLNKGLYAICFFLCAGEYARITFSFNELDDNVVAANMADKNIPTENKVALFSSLAESFPVNAQSQHQKLTLFKTFKSRIEKAPT